jgi:hypothetical protein
MEKERVVRAFSRENRIRSCSDGDADMTIILTP